MEVVKTFPKKKKKKIHLVSIIYFFEEPETLPKS